MIMFLMGMLVAPIRVAVIDSGYRDDIKPYLCTDVASLDFTGEGSYDYINHGNIVSKIILEKSNYNACIISIKIFNKNNSIMTGNYEEALKYLDTVKVEIINISMEGNEQFDFEKDFLKKKQKQNIPVIVAAGNHHKDLDKKCLSFPACLGFGIKVIGTKDKNLLTSYTNYGNVVNSYEEEETYENQKGTSFSTASYSGKLAKRLFDRSSSK